jgi:hypothetical protein
MKLQKQVTIPKIETDLSRIQQLSKARDDENWEFRSWLKQYAPDEIDGLLKALSLPLSGYATILQVSGNRGWSAGPSRAAHLFWF